MVSKVRKGIFSWIAIALAGTFLGAFQALADQPLVLKAGAVAIDITPENLPVETCGSMTPHTTAFVHDRLFARCLVLDNGTTQLALVVCDSCMIPRELIENSKQKIFQQTQIPVSHILCSANHSHSAVCVARVFQSNVDQEYIQLMQDRIAAGVIQAWQQREPAKIGWALGNNSSQVFNRRWYLRPGNELNDPFELGTDKVRMNPAANHSSLLRPAGPTDPGVPVLAVQAVADSRPIAIWSNYSLHYVGGIPNGGLSGDYYGEFAKQLSAQFPATSGHPPFVAAMTNGTSGDVNNINFFEGPPGGRQPFEQIQYVAADLAKTVHATYQRIEYRQWVPLAAVAEQIELGVRKPDDTELQRAKAILESSGEPPYRNLVSIYANETIHMSQYPDSVEAPLQVLQIGDVGIAATPCETFAETGLAIKQDSPFALSFTIELANGYNGYLPTPEQHALGGYETWRAKSSYLAVDAEPKIRAALLRMMNQLATNANPKTVLSQVDGSSTDSSDQSSLSDAQKKTTEPALATLDALGQIESTRGGRHWVDEPTDPPKSPGDSLACFQIEPGLSIELVAAEPLVYDPVWIAFDQYGRMFVAEYSDYPVGPEGNDPTPLSKIVMLEDLDGDHRMDRRTVFADKLDFVHSFMPFRDGLLVGAKTEILYLRDIDGDNIADLRETLYRGFAPAHPQMQIGCPVWGFDNWIYMTYGAGHIERAEGSSLFAAGANAPAVKTQRDFRFHPSSYDFGPSSGFGQFGHTLDSRGNRFFCTNRNPIMAAPILPEEFRRSPHVIFPVDQYDVAPAGGDSLVYPLIEMKSNYLSHAGTHTAACGVTCYTGDLLGQQWLDSVMVCEPIGHLITRTIVQSDGSTLQGKRARPQAEFLASTDRWFRPSSLANGPDGALYVADMYRLWVEHPKFLPPEIAAKLDWRAGEDRGRIWRIVPDRPIETVRYQPPQSVQQLVSWLSHPNGWHRELAQRLLVERQEHAAQSPLRAILRDGQNELAMQRALWTLDGIGRLQIDDLLIGIGSSYSSVRSDAVRLARRFLHEPQVFNSVLKTSEDPSPQVKLQCSLTLGDLATSVMQSPAAASFAIYNQQAASALARIAIASPGDDWIARAILTSSSHREVLILQNLVIAIDQKRLPASSGLNLLMTCLGETIGTAAKVEDLKQVAALIGGGRPAGQWWQSALLSGLAEGLPRGPGVGTHRSLSSLLNEPPMELKDSVAQLQNLMEATRRIALDRSAAEANRQAAIELLAHLPKSNASGDVILRLLDPIDTVPVQLAALGQMSRRVNPDDAVHLITQWPQLSPPVRAAAITFLLQRKESCKLALEAMQRGQLSAAVLNIDQRVLLLAHPDQNLKMLARSVIGSGISPDRQQVASQYQKALKITGDIQAGQQVFDRICAACHRFHGRGHDVGPDISDTRNRSREALLFDILDPNQKLEPKYTAYQVLTVDGSVFHGLLIAESPGAIILQLAEGKQQTIARADIESLAARGQSLMPEGVERDVSIQQMADLIEFLKSGP